MMNDHEQDNYEMQESLLIDCLIELKLALIS